MSCCTVEWHQASPSRLESAGLGYYVVSMCGRYASFLPAEAIARIFGTVNPLPIWHQRGTWHQPWTRRVDCTEEDRRTSTPEVGLVPYFTKDLKKARKPINARSESIARSGMFKDAFARRRCLVPAPVYYEWRDDPDGKTPFAVARIVTNANRQLSAIQDRMPVIVERRIGRSGSARLTAILLRFSVWLRKASCDYGRSARRSGMSKMTVLS